MANANSTSSINEQHTNQLHEANLMLDRALVVKAHFLKGESMVNEQIKPNRNHFGTNDQLKKRFNKI